MKKQILSVALALILTLALLPASAFAESDPGFEVFLEGRVISDWARKGVVEAMEKGFIYYSYTVDYTAPITRLEFCMMALEWLKYATDMKPQDLLRERGISSWESPFTDLYNYAGEITYAYLLGITAGTSATTFSPDGLIDRQQAATMIRNVCRAAGLDIDTFTDAGFADINQAAVWARDGINFVRSNGIMSGTGNNNFTPLTCYTIEQSIVTFNNIDISDVQKARRLALRPSGDPTVSNGIVDFGYDSPSSREILQGEDGSISVVTDNSAILEITVLDSQHNFVRQFTVQKEKKLHGGSTVDAQGNYYFFFAEETRAYQGEYTVVKYSSTGARLNSVTWTGYSPFITTHRDGYSSIANIYERRSSLAASGNLLSVHYCDLGRQGGHQGSTAVTINLNTMQMADVPRRELAGHSWEQQVIVTSNGGFLYVDKGDGSPRGFGLSGYIPDKVRYGNLTEYPYTWTRVIPFNFRSIDPYQAVNAALGGIAELDSGYILAGSSGKVLSYEEVSYNQMGSRNIFYQVVRKDMESYGSDSPELVVSVGETRSAVTSLDITISNYGVVWLTDYTEGNANDPRLFQTESGAVIIWRYDGANYYVVIGNNGQIVRSATKLPFEIFEHHAVWYANGRLYTIHQVWSAEKKYDVWEIQSVSVR